MSKSTSSVQQFVDDSTMLRVGHIPAIARMCHRLGLIDLINASIPCNTDIDLGTLVTGMICDTLSGRSPLYKVEEFIAEQDTELLFGTAVNSHSLNDDALGHALDRIHQNGTLKLITAENLKPLSDLLFIFRFLATHKEHDRVIGQAIDADQWDEIGILAETPSPSIKRQRASYKAQESQVTVEGIDYRALVVQTDQLDQRRSKSIVRQRLKEKTLREKSIQGRRKGKLPLPA